MNPFKSLSRVSRLASLVVACLAATTAKADAVVARIDQYEISAAEFRMFLSWHKAGVARRFFHAAPVVTEAMWRLPQNGGTAAAALRDEALTDALRTKALEIVFVERGLTSSVGFESIQGELATENERLAKARAGGRVVYGPRRWTLDSFYRNRQTELTIRLREQLREPAPVDSAPSSSPDFAALEREIAALARERLAQAKVTIDQAAIAAVPVP